MVHDSLSGKLVVASPGMDDPNFAYAVILMVEHSDEGALGLVLNRPTETKVDEVWDQISVLPCPLDQVLLRGGPCPGPLMLLHNHQRHAQVEVCDGVCFTTEEPLVQDLISEQADPLRFFLGYAGWGPGQLEGELGQGSWLVDARRRTRGVRPRRGRRPVDAGHHRDRPFARDARDEPEPHPDRPVDELRVTAGTVQPNENPHLVVGAIAFELL